MIRMVLVVVSMLLAQVARSPAQVAMTIGAGVDPGFSTFYIAKDGGFFARHGLDVRLETGPSGSAMIAFLIQNQMQVAFGAEQAGIQNFNIDRDVVVVAEATGLLNWNGIVGRNIADMIALKGKRIGVARGSQSEVFWLRVLEKTQLKASDYTVVQVDPPEMIAALARGDIDAFSAWEPWISKGLAAVPDTKVIQDQSGIMMPRLYIYANKTWVIANPQAARAFMTSLQEANDYIHNSPSESAAIVFKFLRLDSALTQNLMSKLRFDLRLDDGSIENLAIAERQLKDMNKLAKPLDWKSFVYDDLLRSVRPESVNFRLPN